MTKPAHDGDWYFAISGIELYGHLIEGDPASMATEDMASGMGADTNPELAAVPNVDRANANATNAVVSAEEPSAVN